MNYYSFVMAEYKTSIRFRSVLMHEKKFNHKEIKNMFIEAYNNVLINDLEFERGELKENIVYDSMIHANILSYLIMKYGFEDVESNMRVVIDMPAKILEIRDKDNISEVVSFKNFINIINDMKK